MSREDYKKLVPMSRNEELLLQIVEAIKESGSGGGSREIETYNDADYVYYRYKGDTEWKKLIELSGVYSVVDDHVDESIVDTIGDSTATQEEVDDAVANLDDL